MKKSLKIWSRLSASSPSAVDDNFARCVMDIGKNIQAIQYKNNMTQDQVVAKLNLMGISITKSTYAKLETNRMNIKASELVALAKLFHTDINAFFSGLL